MGWAHLRVAGTVAVAITSIAGSAAAHGGVPRAAILAIDPADHQRWAALSDAWGLVRSSGAGFTWSCAEAFGEDSLGSAHPRMAMLPGGRILVATGRRGLWRSSENGCDWISPPTLAGLSVPDLAQTRDGSQLFVLTVEDGDAGRSTRVLVSTDGADTFTAAGEPLPPDVTPAALSVASSPVTRFAVGAIDPVEGVVVVLTASTVSPAWITHRLAGVRADGVPRVHLDPLEPSRIFVRIDRIPVLQTEPDRADSIHLSTDGGMSFSLVLESIADLPGLAFSPEGRRVALSGPAEGVLVAETARLGEGISAFEQRATEPLWGLLWTEQGLLAGADDFTARRDRRWLAISHDDGRTFTSVASICDVERFQCSPTSETEQACSDLFRRASGFEQTFLLGPRCVQPEGGLEDASAGGAPNDDGAEPSGCGCKVTRHKAIGGLGWSLVIVALASRRRRRVRTRRT